MKIWSIAKNVMFSLSVTMIYAMWSKEVLHDVSFWHCFAILVSVFIVFFGLLNCIDKEFRKIEKKRKERRNG